MAGIKLRYGLLWQVYVGGINMEYESVIRDECGDIVYACAGLSYDEIDEILENHPEWYLSEERMYVSDSWYWL